MEGRSFPIATEYLTAEDNQAALALFHESGEVASLPALAAYKAHVIHTQAARGQGSEVARSANIDEASSVQRPVANDEAARQQGSKAARNADTDTNIASLASADVEQSHSGHVLIFMPGKREIAETIEYLELLGHQDWLPLPAHSEMDQAEQQLIFQPGPKRKIVVATNIAETSITVEDLGFVIDSGLIREMTFNHRYGIGALLTIEHSKAGLRQRQGRAGRTRPGTYLPLFNKEEYDTGRVGYLLPGQFKRPEYSTPEIQREDLAGAVLRMSQLGIPDLEQFDFMNRPAKGAVHNAMVALKVLGALDKEDKITPLGEQMVSLPVEPRIARMILEAQHFGCVREILTIAACLSTNTVFVRPIGEEIAADAARDKLLDKQGDLFTLLKIIPLYQKQNPVYRQEWAEQHYLNHHVLNEILLIMDQLENLVGWLEIPVTSLRDEESRSKIQDPKKGKTRNSKLETRNSSHYQVLGQAITAGLLQNIAVKKGNYEYQRADGTTMRIHPGSVWADRKPPIIVFTEILQINGSTYAVNVQAVELAWLESLAPHLLSTKQEALVHPWKGTVVGQYTITTLSGMEIGRQYSGKRLPQHLMNEDRRHHRDKNGKKEKEKPRRKGRAKHEARKRKDKGKRRKASRPGESWTN